LTNSSVNETARGFSRWRHQAAWSHSGNFKISKFTEWPILFACYE